MRPPFRLLVLTALLVGGCELFGPDATAPRSALGLDPGTTFTYRATFAVFDTAGHAVPVASEDFIVRVLRETEPIGPHRGLLRLQAVSAGADTAGGPATDVWYRETADRLEEVAYRNAGATAAVTPKNGMTGTTELLWQPRSLAALADAGLLPTRAQALDSLIVREEPRLVYELPLADGARWITIRDPFIQAREVVGTDTVQVPAGTFVCRVILTRVPVLLPGLLWVDCVAREGLVVRDILTETVRIDGTLLRTRERMELVALRR